MGDYLLVVGCALLVSSVVLIVLGFLCKKISDIRDKQYKPGWKKKLDGRLLAKLEILEKTPDDDYVAKVVLKDGSIHNIAHFGMERELERENNQVGIMDLVSPDRGFLIDAGEITDVLPSPYRVPNDLARQAFRKGESGMGYFRVNIQLKNGSVLKDVFCVKPYLLRLPEPYTVADIEKIEHAGFH